MLALGLLCCVNSLKVHRIWCHVNLPQIPIKGIYFHFLCLIGKNYIWLRAHNLERLLAGLFEWSHFWCALITDNEFLLIFFLRKKWIAPRIPLRFLKNAFRLTRTFNILDRLFGQIIEQSRDSEPTVRFFAIGVLITQTLFASDWLLQNLIKEQILLETVCIWRQRTRAHPLVHRRVLERGFAAPIRVTWGFVDDLLAQL